MSKNMKAAAVGMISVFVFGCSGSGGSSVGGAENPTGGGGGPGPVIAELPANDLGIPGYKQLVIAKGAF
jgi:hypothetical protein